MINKLGFDIYQFRSDQVGYDPIRDIRKFSHMDNPLIFDVGANVGQSILRFSNQFPNYYIHSFEPSPSIFLELKKQARRYKNVRLWNCALGSSSGIMTLYENSNSDMSSFLSLGKSGWGTITKETPVEVKTIDQVVCEEKIDFIDILKSDTQGFDLEVFKGAEETFKSNKIGFVFFEVNFSDIYNNSPSFSEEFDFLIRRNFRLVSFYRFYYHNNLAQWTDALFVHESYL
jgi:FkbM family methyltransferase